MLLAVDVGNTQTAVGLFSGKELAASWRFATDVRKTGDEIAALLDALLQARRLLPRVGVGSGRRLGGAAAERRVLHHGRGQVRPGGAGRGPRRQDRHAHPHQRSPPGGPRPHRRRGRGLRGLRRSLHRRGLRHGDDVQRRLRRRRVSGPRHRSGHRDLPGRARHPGRPAAQDRAGRPGLGHRQEHGPRHAGGGASTASPGRWTASCPGCGRNWAGPRSPWPPAAWRS